MFVSAVGFFYVRIMEGRRTAGINNVRGSEIRPSSCPTMEV